MKIQKIFLNKKCLLEAQNRLQIFLKIKNLPFSVDLMHINLRSIKKSI